MTFDATLEKDNFRQLFKDNIDQFKEAVKLAFREALPSLPPEFKIIDREIYLELKPPFLPPPFNAISATITKELYYAEAKKIYNDFQNELFINKFNEEIENSVSDVNLVKVWDTWSK